ncbi:MAG: type 1 glutamine amidotransferase domain-containing protein [Pseudomonadota bacterium]
MGGDIREKDTYRIAPIPERLKKHDRVAILTADKTEDIEFFYPYYRLSEAGYDVDVITPHGGRFEAKHGLGLNETMPLKSAKASNYDLLYIPGGKAPEELRTNEEVLEFVRAYAMTGKPIAAICHGPQVLAAAGLLQGRQVAAWPGIKDEILQAGATFIDEALVIDDKLVTSRMPGDLHRHLYGVLEVLSGIPYQGRMAA